MKGWKWFSQARRKFTLAEMKKMSTKRLLAYKRSIYYPSLIMWECDEEHWVKIREFFTDQMGKLAKVLATREHVDRPGKRRK